MRTSILVTVLAVMLAACGKDSVGTGPANLSGTWRLSESTPGAVATLSASVVITQTGQSFTGTTGEWTLAYANGQPSERYAREGVYGLMNGTITSGQVQFDKVVIANPTAGLTHFTGQLSSGKVTGSWEQHYADGTTGHYPFTMERP